MEASDRLNFVLKDDATATWYDCHGTNFVVDLHKSATEAKRSQDIPAPPKELCDVWAWIKWDYSGRPNRGQAQAQLEYDNAISEMLTLLRAGRPLDELQRVARGEVLYKEYKHNIIDVITTMGSKAPATAAPAAPAAPAPPAQMPSIPNDLISLQAYVLWERNHKPHGADFGPQARSMIEDQLREGLTLQEIESRLRNPSKAAGAPPAATPAAPPPAPAAAPPTQSAPPPPPAAAAPAVEVGKSLGTATRNPLQMIKKQQVPQLSSEKSTRVEKPLEFLVQRAAVDERTRWRRVYQLGSRSELLAIVRQEQEGAPVTVSIITDTATRVVLHWAITAPGSRDWRHPSEKLWPAGTKEVEAGPACESLFEECDDDECDVEVLGSKVPLQRITLTIPADEAVSGLTFVIRSEDGTRWYKDANSNFFVPIPGKHVEEVEPADPLSAFKTSLDSAIANEEINAYHWTLMHRYNKAADLINEVLSGGITDMEPVDAMAHIYVWLRLSATRQLTWQRNYNTQPRILSAAQERLTNAISSAHSRTAGETQEWVRLMLSTVGRGGDGQRIRDEILHIMHRNGIPELKGTWMEEWHQKLHNNTTPDDVPICQAYIAFLESNGNLGAYWRTLSDNGVTRQRLEGFDRPIVNEPKFPADKKDALIREFRNYLGILKAVHSGADLQASAAAVGNRLPAGARGYLGYVLGHLADPQVLPFMEAAVEARTELAEHLSGNRELLYLDIALENAVRAAAERGAGSAGFGAAAFMGPLLQNLALSRGDNEEVCFCLKAWQGLPPSVKAGGRPKREEALLAVSVVSRIRRELAEISDTTIRRIDEFAQALGHATKCEDWAIDVFSEEVVRGGPAFAVSLVISSIEPTLRTAAALGAWQIISPHNVTGVIMRVPDLHGVQDEVYEEPTVLLVDHVSGEEEVPEGVVGLLTPDAPDVLSHLSVRARNMRVLFATCHEEEPLQQLAGLVDKYVSFSTTAAGAVTWKEAAAGVGASDANGNGAHAGPAVQLKISVPKWVGKWVVGMDEYANDVVGAKSKNLANLRGKLPDWIKLPACATLPFGCFEQALEDSANKDMKKELHDTVSKMSAVPRGHADNSANGAHDSASALLAHCRNLAMKVKLPAALREQLSTAMKSAGIPVPEDEARWALAEQAIKGVWASKFNDRAYYSLKKVGLNFDDVRMAVLVQRVVPAQYAFVIHTKNPSNNDDTEVFCELVKGLGESLVSGMVPGSSVAFKAKKDRLDEPEVLAYASKSEGMFVRESLIFRSDSNGEDLEGYAGAGLYESITMDPTLLQKVDYMEDRLVTDQAFRRDLLSRICKVGAAIESALGSAQDVEGVVGPDGSITVVQTRPQV